MSVWYTITIDNPGKLTADKLADKLGDSLWELGITDPRREWDTPSDHLHHPAEPDAKLTAQGGSKYTVDEVFTVARKLSRKAGRTVTVHEEWDTRDADEQGANLTTYRDGERVAAEAKHTDLVTDTLPERLTAARKALDTPDCDSARLGHIERELRALVDILTPATN